MYWLAYISFAVYFSIQSLYSGLFVLDSIPRFLICRSEPLAWLGYLVVGLRRAAWVSRIRWKPVAPFALPLSSFIRHAC